MEWFTYADGLRIAPSLVGTCAPQIISVMADVSALTKDIPTQPELIPSDNGPPGPTQQWCGRIDDRLITIECEANNSVEERGILIRTGFLKRQDELGDWSAILDLQELPTSIHITRPLFIESRNVGPDCAVYRAHTQGWNTLLYRAASRTEAEDLLTFLRQDRWNEGCFIGEPEPPGKWATIQGDEVILGGGSELNSALRFACEWSLRYAPVVLLVKDVSGINNDVHVVSQGRVLQPSERPVRYP
jgi:hypothetical protein